MKFRSFEVVPFSVVVVVAVLVVTFEGYSDGPQRYDPNDLAHRLDCLLFRRVLF